MTSFFLTCAVIGGVVLIAQLALGLMGAGHHGDMVDHHDGTASEGLHLLSVRAISAGVAFFGIGGLGTTVAGWPSILAMIVAVLLGAVSMVGVAWAMRSMMRLEEDKSVQMQSAVGASATVYIPVPGSLGGVGKVLVSMQGRTIECEAVTSDANRLPTGMPVVVVDVREHDVVEVVPLPTLDGVA